MAVIIDGTTGITTPGETNTGNLSVAGSTTLTAPLPVLSGGTGASSLSGITTGTSTNLAGGVAGAVPYQSGVGATGFSAAGTSGQPVVSGGAGAPVFRPYTLPASDGSANQVLQTNGAGALSFATPSAGALTFLSTVTASSSSTVDIETTFNNTYDAYLLVVSNIVVSNDNAILRGRFKLSGAYVTSATYYGKLMNLVSTTTSFNADNTDAATSFLVGTSFGSDTSDIAGYNINIYNPSSTTKQKRVVISGVASASSGVGANQTTTFFGSGSNSGTGAMTGLRFFMSAGNIVSGTFRLYGIANS